MTDERLDFEIQKAVKQVQTNDRDKYLIHYYYYLIYGMIQSDIPSFCKTKYQHADQIKLCTNRYSGMKNYDLINKYSVEIQKNLTEARDAVIITPIIYDEITNFKDAVSYPYEKRKNTLISNKNEIPNDPAAGNAIFKQGELRKVFLNVESVCFDKKWYSDILFWKSDEPCGDGGDSKLKFKKI